MKNDKEAIRSRLYLLTHYSTHVQAMETYAKIPYMEGIFKRIYVGRGLQGPIVFQENGFLGEVPFLLC